MTEEQIDKANIIIYSSAKGSAMWTGITTALSVGEIGIIADTPGMTLIIVDMVKSLANLFNRNLGSEEEARFINILLGSIIGSTVKKILLGYIPLVGAGANALLNYRLLESIGWGIVQLFEDGKEISKLTKDELKSYIKNGKKRASEMKEKYDKMIQKLNSDSRKAVETLQETLVNPKVSAKQKQEIIQQINLLIKNHQRSNEII